MDFFQATSDLLPTVDLDMVVSYLQSNISFASPEIRGVKAARAAKPEYGDKAIGWVELKRDGPFCHVRGKICPEHKIRNQPYKVAAIINEAIEEIVSVECLDCAASKGGCKHAVAFLFWLHRRSEEPSPTETVSYWRKSPMSSLGNIKHATVEELCKGKVVQLPNRKCNLLEAAQNFFTPGDCPMITLNWRDTSTSIEGLSLNNLIVNYKELQMSPSSENFLEFCRGKMTQELCNSVEEATRDQAESKLWHEFRFGRVTASNLWACSRYKRGSSLLDSLLGAGKPIETQAMSRGKLLEPLVVTKLIEELDVPLIRSGIILNSDYPFLGASPDAIADNFVVEVKCPSKKETVQNYLKDGELSARCQAQIQLQMLMSGRPEGLFVVAEPTSKDSLELNFKWVPYDHATTSNLIQSAKNFWSAHIFEELFQMY